MVLTIDHTQGNQARLSWLLYDGHGNLVRTMASNYVLSGYQWRGVWGEVQSSLGAGRGYCANLGHPEDETGLVYMRARYYEPATGRFISEDPARDGVNWYLYADGNPVNRVDEDGGEDILELPYMRLLSGIASAAYAFLRMWGIGPQHYWGAIVSVLGWAGRSIRSAQITVAAASYIMRVPNPVLQYLAYGMMVAGIGLAAATVVLAIVFLHALVLYFLVQSTFEYIEGGETK
ncbi:RHS repeat-associated core domain-containing protein [Armatimonadetes bacterium GBS]|nr:MAG: hypothetical protein KatS3mg021_2344 [Fimbriimonadales bacterium]CUU09548.1 RHS repeat-associated core domain-containing protein [Armatimonadetes bacterium GBS]CUU35142.1 RHS repeat-associated core domain-containing protein [Armatimonadetes bacterium GXS]